MFPHFIIPIEKEEKCVKCRGKKMITINARNNTSFCIRKNSFSKEIDKRQLKPKKAHLSQSEDYVTDFMQIGFSKLQTFSNKSSISSTPIEICPAKRPTLLWFEFSNMHKHVANLSKYVIHIPV